MYPLQKRTIPILLLSSSFININLISFGQTSLSSILIEFSISLLGRNFIKVHSDNSGFNEYNFSTAGNASSIPSALITKSLFPFFTELISNVRSGFILCN